VKISRTAARSLLTAALVLALNGRASSGDAPRLHPGAVELGLAGSVVSSGSSGRATSVAVRGEILHGAGPGLAGFGAEVAWRHVGNVGDLDRIRTAAHVSWQAPLGESSAYPFAALWAGLDHERVGSFGQTRFPLGVGAGVRALVSPSAAVRLEYRFARVRDPDADDFNEHEVLTGVTLLLRNTP